MAQEKWSLSMDEGIISKELLEILACPLCKTDLQLREYVPGQFGLKCVSCRGIYPIRDGIPIMLIDDRIWEDKDK